jgi:threonine dehydrogenase-like Zn-dependent dehydrogenase
MRALVFDLSIAKYLLGKAVSGRVRRVYYGPGTCFALRDAPVPELPSDDWVVLAPRLTGFCGSDLSTIFFKMSPVMSAVSLASGESAVLGHEVLADVVSVGSGAKGRVKEGDRVVVDPVLGCDARGEVPCTRCAVGEYATCHRFGTGSPKGIMLGACSRLPGGFGERMVAHKSQVFRVPDSMSDTRAVLTEPLAVGAHAVFRHPPKDGEKVLVVGGGIIAFSVLWAIREICPTAEVTLFTVEDYQLPIALSLGASRAWSPKGGSLMKQAALATSSSVLKPAIGRGFLTGGFSRVYDCVGSRASLDDAMRLTDGGGTLVLVGAAGILPSLDMTFVWSRELKVEGTVFYGHEQWRGKRARTFDACLELLTTTTWPVDSLVTHTFPLKDYARAIDVNLDRAEHRSIKAVFDVRAA